MTAVNFPFAASGSQRVPTAQELIDGFPCGPLDLPLWNFLMYWLTGQADGVIEKSGLVTDDSDLTRLAKAIRRQRLNWFTAGGTATVMTITPDPAFASLAELIGVPLFIKPPGAATGAATLNVNGLGAIAINRSDGTPVEAWDWSDIDYVPVMYDGTRFQMLGVSSQGVNPGTGGTLTFVSATQIKLVPENGGRLWINGKNYQVPSAGVTIANTGLAANTTYYVYAYMSGTTMTLEISATGYTSHANGIPQKTGDATRTLVGMIRTQGSTPGQFQGGALQLSYFNRRSKRTNSNGSQSGTTNATSATEINSAARANFLTWADETFIMSIIGFAWNAAASISFYSTIGLDGAVISNVIEQVHDVAGSKCTISQTLAYTDSEGFHYVTPMGATGNAANQAQYNGLGSSIQVMG